MRSRSHRQAGFTLVELLTVLGIIGILAAIAVPQFSSRQGKAFDARIKQDARNVATAQEAYFTDNLTYASGGCSALPGAKISDGVVCTTTGDVTAFTVQTTHPRATVSCTYSTSTAPNLICS
jgi:prepilin-type N-terminal cleavage/methylation domain-containing protein